MPETEARNRRKVRQGQVTSLAGEKTITVTINERIPHPKYKKMMNRSKKLHVHDEKGEAALGDTVRVMETRPLSKTKRWRLVDVVEKAE